MLWLRCSWLALAIGCFAVQAEAADADAVDAKSREVLKSFVDQFRAAKSLSVAIDSTTTVSQQGEQNSFRNSAKLTLARPNLLSIRLTHGTQALQTISDGKRLLVSFPALRRYTVGSAPATIDDAMGNGSQRMINLQHGLLFITTLLNNDDPLTAYLDDVNGTKYLGSEEVAGMKCHRIRLDVKPMTWDLWIDAGEKPLLRQASPDLAGLFARQNGGALPEGLKINTNVTYSGWSLDPEVDPKTFTIEPPQGLQQVDSLFDSGEEPETHPLVGTPAPTFKLDLVSGGQVDLAALKGQIVVLDFWATWCGPCVRALPQVVATSKKYADKGVKLYAVNLREEPADIKAFLQEHKLDVSVALDKEGKTAEAYGVEGIPQSVIIGKDGTVQVVHVGASPDLEQQLTRELEALIANKNLAEAALKDQTLDATGLTPAWSVVAKAGALAGNGRGTLMTTAGRMAQQFDAQGKPVDAFALGATARQLRLFRTQPKGVGDLLMFSVWERTLVAQKASGDLLWTHDDQDGIDDVAVVDFDGDGRDEVVIGFNGGGGVLALDNAGKELWRFKEIGNAWHIAAGDVTGDKAPEVISTSAEGDLYVFDRTGKLLKKINAGCEAMHVGVFRPTAASGDGQSLILTAGTNGEHETLEAIDFAGKTRWQWPVEPKNDAFETIVVSSSRPWAAITTATGTIHIVDLDQGKPLARLTGKKPMPITWLDQEGTSPLLVVSTGNKLAAYKVDGAK